MWASRRTRLARRASTANGRKRTKGNDTMTTTNPARPVYDNLRKALGTDYLLLKAGVTAEELDCLARTWR